MSLYRKYRPKTLSQVIGQEHITRTLRNAFLKDDVHHAHLFIGTRGTGKTSVARILARLINCSNPQDGEPCNECKTCISVIKDRCSDVIEMDAASNRGVDDIEALIERSRFSPMEATKKVYIIDEVHQLSSQAKDALLKTLEDCPKHAMFILATTEGNKVPATIRSRCIQHDFQQASDEEAIEYLKYILDHENIKYEVGALKLIARSASGSYRDAVTQLESIIAWDQGLTESSVREVLGLPTTKQIQNILKAIFSGDALIAINAVQEAKKISISYTKFIEELIPSIFTIIRRLVKANENEVFGLTGLQLTQVALYIANKRKVFELTSEPIAFELIIIDTTLYVAELKECTKCKSEND